MNNQFMDIPSKLPLLPVKETIPFPHMLLSLYIGQSSSKKSVEEALKNNKYIFLTAQKDPDTSVVTENSVYKIGIVGTIMRMRKLKNGRMKILVQGISRGVIEQFHLDGICQSVDVNHVSESEVSDEASVTLVNKVKASLRKLSEIEGYNLSIDLINVLDQVSEPSRLTDLITGNLNLKLSDMQKILETFDSKERLSLLHTFLDREIEISQMQKRIKNIINTESTKVKSAAYASSASRKFDLGGAGGDSQKSEEIQELSKKIKDRNMPKDIEEDVMKHLGRLEKMHPEASEASIIRNYLDWMCQLPWDQCTEDVLDLKKAEDVLDEDHFGLNVVKERILEFLAVRKLKVSEQSKAPILCFVGPPGVGKTSLGKSIAKAMGRKYVRVALGGIKDEAEIRGHRRTYVGAMPGKIIQALKQAGSKNPVIVLDELDKLGSDFRGDPSAAMLEVLDPEQNDSFRDHYLNANFDLSQILFIATANVFDTIPLALRDRMEIIQIPGYTPNEKLNIAEKYIVRKEMHNNGVNDEQLSFTKKGIQFLINHYTREAGLRNLSREVGSVCRKTAKKIVLGEDKQIVVTPDMVKSLLGRPRFLKEDTLAENKVGICTGLAWTQVGGEILYIECIKISGKEGFTLTGQLGKVMEESAKTAFSYVRSYSETLGVPCSWFENNEIHIHLPAGAVPKDGPSAGVALATSLISLITGIPIRKDIAMTGEIGLQGQVLPVGGIKEKVLAALNHGLKTVILPKKNRGDLEDDTDPTIKELNQKLKFVFVDHVSEVFSLALERDLNEKKILTDVAA